MTKSSIETRDIVTALLDVEREGKQDVMKVRIQETFNDKVIADAEIHLSLKAFCELVSDVGCDLGYLVVEADGVV